jgi:UDP-N-acetyl-D-glucosamine dehydrogenase
MNDPSSIAAVELQRRIVDRSARVAVIGLGYVGLPLVRTFAEQRFHVTGFDNDTVKIEKLVTGRSYIRHLRGSYYKALVDAGRFVPTSDYAQLARVDVVLICVPTPLDRHSEPDLSFVKMTGEAIARHLRRGQLVILESTTYPGTTRDILRAILEKSGLRVSQDFFLAYSPEREDPGNSKFETATIPKVVGADDPESRKLALALYEQIVSSVVPVRSAATAEAVKLTENIFRAVNIALANELKVVFGAMGIDVWEVIDAAKTKPFGYMPFYPGPGLGGHCIPIDPFYLTWKAREYGIRTRLIELAGEINTSMPALVVRALAEALDQRFQRGINGSRILLLGVAYKKNVDDMRESPALRLMEILQAHGARVAFYDPFVPEIPSTREHAALAGKRSIAWSEDALRAYDASVIVTDHDGVDYNALVQWSRLVLDTRNATHGVSVNREVIVKA